MNADGAVPTRVTNNAAEDKSPTWSPDGTKLAFNRNNGSQRSIFVINPDGSGETFVVFTGTTTFPEPVWSPDGGKIAYVSQTPTVQGIATVNPDGTGATAVCCSSPGAVRCPTGRRTVGESCSAWDSRSICLP